MDNNFINNNPLTPYLQPTVTQDEGIISIVADFDEARKKHNDAKVELSQNQQTLALTTQLNAIAAAIAKIPTTAAAGA